MGVLTETVVPVFGNLLATAMLLSPFPAAMRLRSTGTLGDINPLPYPMTCVNCAGWVAYGYATANPYIFPANVIGFLAGMFFTLTAFTCAPRKLQDRIAAIFVAASAYIIMLGMIACFGLTKKETQRMWGTSAVAILMLYYVVPLSTMLDILRTRNAASIYPPLAATAIANGTLWAVYGLAIMDINLWLPNLFGALIGALQLLLRFVYGARAAPEAGSVGGKEAAADEEMAAGNSDTPRAGERLDSSSNLLVSGGRSGFDAVAGSRANGPAAPLDGATALGKAVSAPPGIGGAS